jgi:hypothetical protein
MIELVCWEPTLPNSRTGNKPQKPRIVIHTFEEDGVVFLRWCYEHDGHPYVTSLKYFNSWIDRWQAKIKKPPEQLPKRLRDSRRKIKTAKA